MKISNVVLLGSSSVGKTTILKTFKDKKFYNAPQSTIGFEFVAIQVSQGKKIQFWDTAGQERFKSLSSGYIKKADGIILVYDPNEPDKDIQDDLTDWIIVIKNNIDINRLSDCIWIIANNKKSNDIIEEEEKYRIKRLFRNEIDVDKLRVLNGLSQNPKILEPIFQKIINTIETKTKDKKEVKKITVQKKEIKKKDSCCW